MSDWLFGNAAFFWIATWAHPVLDVFFKVVTDLGYPLFYYLLIAPLFWVVDRRRSMVLFLLLLFAALVNSEAKLFFNTPRPDPGLVRVLDLRPIQSGSASFPSGHAQIAVVFWGYLAYWAGRRWFTWVAGFLIVAIAFSRIYLAAHFPIDVIGGLTLGMASLAVVPWLERWANTDFAMRLPARIAVAMLAVALMFQSGDAARINIAGCLLAFVAMYTLPPPRTVAGLGSYAALVVVGGLVVQIGAAALLGQLAPSPVVTPASGLRIMLLWLIALWVYPHAVAAMVRTPSGTAGGPPATGP